MESMLHLVYVYWYIPLASKQDKFCSQFNIFLRMVTHFIKLIVPQVKFFNL